MTDQHRLPPDADAAIAELTSIGSLVTSKEWDRAALVFALVGPGDNPQGGRPRTDENSSVLPVDRLAAKGIIGLTTKDSVRHYRDCWTYAVKEGKAQPVHLGDTYVVPDLPFPPNRTVGRGMDDDRRQRLMEAGQEAGMRTGSKVVDVVSNVNSVIAGIKADPEFARTIMEDIDATTALSRAEQDTERSHEMGRSLRRGHTQREAQAAEAGPPRLRPGLRAVAAFFELDASMEQIIRDYQHDEEGAGVARMLAAILEHRAGTLRAWADGLAIPPTDEEFERESRALLGEQP